MCEGVRLLDSSENGQVPSRLIERSTVLCASSAFPRAPSPRRVAPSTSSSQPSSIFSMLRRGKRRRGRRRKVYSKRKR
jgi:hypothetical protein